MWSSICVKESTFLVWELFFLRGSETSAWFDTFNSLLNWIYVYCPIYVGTMFSFLLYSTSESMTGFQHRKLCMKKVSEPQYLCVLLSVYPSSVLALRRADSVHLLFLPRASAFSFCLFPVSQEIRQDDNEEGELRTSPFCSLDPWSVLVEHYSSLKG